MVGLGALDRSHDFLEALHLAKCVREGGNQAVMFDLVVAGKWALGEVLVLEHGEVGLGSVACSPDLAEHLDEFEAAL